jgi:hypothetical protein
MTKRTVSLSAIFVGLCISNAVWGAVCGMSLHEFMTRAYWQGTTLLVVFIVSLLSDHNSDRSPSQDSEAGK